MQITDPVADMLTRIRNANSAKHETVDVPASNLKKDIAKILLDEGYIKAYSVEEDGKQGVIHITLTRRRSFPVFAASPSRACVSTPALRSCRRFSRALASPSFPLPRAS